RVDRLCADHRVCRLAVRWFSSYRFAVCLVCVVRRLVCWTLRWVARIPVVFDACGYLPVGRVLGGYVVLCLFCRDRGSWCLFGSRPRVKCCVEGMCFESLVCEGCGVHGLAFGRCEDQHIWAASFEGAGGGFLRVLDRMI